MDDLMDECLSHFGTDELFRRPTGTEWLRTALRPSVSFLKDEPEPAKEEQFIILEAGVLSTLSLADEFNSLREAWHREYGASSSFTEITRSPSYRMIVQLGEKVLPFIFRDLERRPEPDHWFDALVEITKADPVPAKDRGYSRRMAKAWLKWARAHGYA